MARRRGDYRTWDELSRQERRRGLAMLAVIGAAAVGGMFLLVGGDGRDAPAGAASPPTIDVDAQVSGWYDATESVRSRMAAAVADVRRHIAANDGLSLEPACVVLAGVVRDAAETEPAVVETVNRQWSDGTAAYSRAAEACANLFNGTPIPPPTLLKQTTDELDAADGHWARLAADLGKPALVVPSAGTTPAS